MIPKISALIDKFTYASIDPTKWDVLSNITTGSPTIYNHKLKLEPGQGIRSIADYDLTGSQAYALVEPQGAAANFRFAFEVDSSNSVSIELNNTILAFVLINASVRTASAVAYDSADHAQWRFRERYGQLIYETSPDGNNWIVQRQITHGMDLTRGKMLIINDMASTVTTISYGYGHGPYGHTPYGGSGGV